MSDYATWQAAVGWAFFADATENERHAKEAWTFSQTVAEALGDTLGAGMTDIKVGQALWAHFPERIRQDREGVFRMGGRYFDQAWNLEAAGRWAIVLLQSYEFKPTMPLSLFLDCVLRIQWYMRFQDSWNAPSDIAGTLDIDQGDISVSQSDNNLPLVNLAGPRPMPDILVSSRAWHLLFPFIRQRGHICGVTT